MDVWPHHDIDFVHLACGSLFFLLAALSDSLKRNQDERLPWGWLAGFAILQGLHEWLYIPRLGLETVWPLDLLQYFTISSAFVLLAEFGRRACRQAGYRLITHPALYIVLLIFPVMKCATDLQELAATLRAGFGFTAALLAAVGFLQAPDPGLGGRAYRVFGSAALILYAFGAGIFIQWSPLPGLSQLVAPGLAPEIVRIAAYASLAFSVWRLALLAYTRESKVVPNAPPTLHAYMLVALALAFLLGGFYATTFTERMADRKLRQDMLVRVTTIAAALDRTVLLQLSGMPSDASEPAYDEVQSILTRIRMASRDTRFLYLYGYRDRSFFFHVSARTGNPEEDIGAGEVYEGELDPEDFSFMWSGRPYTSQPYQDKWGLWVSAFAPVLRDTRTGRVEMALGLDLDAHDYLRQIYARRGMPLLATGMLVLTTCITYTRHRRLWEVALLTATSESRYRRLSEELEQRVVDRTSALSQANETLIGEIKNREIAEQDADKARNRYRTLTEQLPAITYTVSLDDTPHTAYISPQVQELLGYSPEEWVNTPGLWRKILHPEDRDRVFDLITEHDRLGQDFAIEHRMLSRQGQVIWFYNNAKYIKDQQGQVTSVQGVMLNITDRKNAEQIALSEKLILDQVAQGLPLEDILKSLCLAVERMVPGGLCSIHLAGKEGTHLVQGAAPSLHPEYVQATARIQIAQGVGSCGAAAFTGERVIVADIQTHPNWEKFRDLASVHQLRACWSQPFKSREGRVLGTLALYYREVREPGAYDLDIITRASNLAGIAVARERADEAVRASGEMYRLLFDHSPVGIFHYNQRLRITDCNARFCEIFRTTRYRIKEADLSLIRDPSVLPALQMALKGHEGFHEGRALGSLADREGWFTLRTSPLLNPDGTVAGAIGIVEDITEQTKVEEERIKSQKLESLGLLAGGIAHDFNNILTAILGNVSQACELTRNQVEAHTMLLEAEQACGRARDLTQQLLTFAKGGEPVKKPRNIGHIIQATAQLAMRGSSNKCELDLPGDLWPAEVDGGQIGQVIQNLVINADQATKGGGRIEVAARNVTLQDSGDLPLPPGPYCRITVRDFGIGIPAQNLSRIFDPYFTTKPGGTGLGLTTSYSIIKRHGGHLEVTSAPGKGTTMQISLPASPGANLEQEPARALAGPVPSQGGARILILDDDKSVLLLGNRVLQRAGYTVETAEEGLDALRKHEAAFRKHTPFHLVILDLTLPGSLSGIEVLSLMRVTDPHVLAIVSSGYSTDPVLSDFAAFGFNGMVPKPYHSSELLSLVAKILKESGKAS